MIGFLDLASVFGRLHPLVLHLPIGIGVALFIIELLTWFLGFEESRRPHGILACLAAATAWISVATGYVLNGEGAFAPADVDPHRNAALVCAGALTIAAAAHLKSNAGARVGFLRIYRLFLTFGIVTIIAAGHLGATLTHGQSYLTGFRGGAEATESTNPASAPVPGTPGNDEFTNKILPIFESKCNQCHGEEEQKAKLALNTREAMMAGSKHGPVIHITNRKESELLVRIERPAEEKGHMPPKNKPQLTDDERKTIGEFILKGNFAAAASNAKNEAAPAIVQETVEPSADEKDIAALREALVHVQPISQGSKLLWIDFAAPATRMDEEQIVKLLKPVARFTAELSLNRSKITDGGLEIVASMPALRRLELRSTAVGDGGILFLKNHPALEELVMTQTKAGDASVDVLLTLQKLRKIYIWGGAFSADGIAKLRRERPELKVDAGDAPAAGVVKIEDPIKLTSDAPPPGAPAAPPGNAVILTPINSVCPVSGQPVDPKYQIVFEGRVIGFCCTNCPNKFWANPAEFKAKLPQ